MKTTNMTPNIDINKNVWIYDIETYANLFTVVALEPHTGIFVDFVMHDIVGGRNDRTELLKWLKTKPSLVGYNNLKFDGQVLEHILRGHLHTGTEVFEFAQSVIGRLKTDRWDSEYDEWKKKLTELDLMSVNHYGIGSAKTTSLKWLGFSMRRPSMQDLPYHFTEMIDTQKKVDAIIKYNKKDVEDTYAFYLTCQEDIDLRKGLYREYKEPRLINMSEPSISSFMLKEILSEELKLTKPQLKKLKTDREQIVVKDLIRNYINFKNPEFNEALRHFQSKVLRKNPNGEIELKGKKVLGFSMEFGGLTYEYGAGGLHACISPGCYEPKSDEILIDLDFASYYPWLAITGDIFPEHLSKKFTIILEKLYNERKRHPKGSIKNKSLKLVLNSIYGLFNNKYSIVFDPQCTVSTTVNGQLLLSMLCDRLSQLGQIIQVNTDGLTMMIKKVDLEILRNACKSFESLTGLILEEVQYSKMVIKDVNNYLSIDLEGNVKRKGMFETYDDIKGSYHKNPSASIIPQALSEYYINGVNVEDTILTHNNIHDFLIGIKNKSNFEYVGIQASEDIVTKIERKKFEGRVVRYYISKDGFNIFKHFLDNRVNNLQAVNKGFLVTPLPTVTRTEIIHGKESPKAKRGSYRYSGINYDYYIDQCHELINTINQKDVEKLQKGDIQR
jgi:hypothetical protein